MIMCWREKNDHKMYFDHKLHWMTHRITFVFGIIDTSDSVTDNKNDVKWIFKK